MAASVRFAEGAPVIGEGARLDRTEIHATLPKTALTAVDTTFDIVLGDKAAAALADAMSSEPRVTLSPDTMITGIASFYEGAQETSSGEQYDPEAFTAAAQLEIRDKFGGIRFGKNYEPAYAIGEFGGKKIIVKFNDVGPLKPGRKFDLSRAAMAYFDDSLKVGLLPEFKMTPLPLGQAYQTGPVSDEQLVAMGIAYGDDIILTASIPAAEETAGEAETAMAEIAFAVVPEPEMSRADALQEVAAFADPDATATNLPVVFASKIETDRIAGLRLDGPWFVGDAQENGSTLAVALEGDAERLDQKILAALGGSGICLVPELHHACGEIAAAIFFLQPERLTAMVAVASVEANTERADENVVSVLPHGRHGESGPERQRKDGKVEDGAGFPDVFHRLPLI